MISLSKTRRSKILKLSMIVMAIYIVVQLVLQIKAVIENRIEKEVLTQKLQKETKLYDGLKSRVKNLENRIKKINESYLPQKEVEEQFRAFYQNFDTEDLSVELMASQKLCIDRYALVTALYAEDEESYATALDILKDLGKIYPYQGSDEILILDHVLKAKE